MMEIQRYQVTQDDKDYILSTSINNDTIRIECKENNYQPSQIFSREFSRNELISLSNIFNYYPTLYDVQNELNSSIEREQVQIINLGDSIDLLFNLRANNNTYNQEITFKLFPSQNIQQNNYFQSVATNPNINPIIVQQPIYKDINAPSYKITTYEEEFPDCTYSTKPAQNFQSFQNIQNFETIPMDVGCGCPRDQDRITKIEYDSNLMKIEHDKLLQRLNNLKMGIQMFKKYTSNLRNENGILNMKTLELKKRFKELLEAEAALMAENDELKRENHELILKKNELDFYINEHHDHDNVREVNIPIEQKRRRLTNVSKTEKKFGPGYTSNSGKKGNNSFSGSPAYTSTMANKNQVSQFRNKIEDFY